MPMQADPKRGKVFVPCAFNPKAGADEKMCKRLSGTPMHARRCDAVECKCEWRVKIEPAADSVDRGSPMPALHDLAAKRAGGTSRSNGSGNGVTSAPVRSSLVAKRPATVPPPPTPAMVEEEESGEWRDVLDRVKVAMANSTLVVLNPEAIRPMAGQPREFFSDLSLTNLRTSIRQVGQVQAGIVRAVDDGQDGVTHELLDGERRWRVVCLESIDVYRAQLVEIDDVAAPYMIAAIANFNREGHTPMEISDAIHKLRTGPIKVPIKAIAEIFGFTEHWTYQMHGLQNLHAEVRAMLDPNLPREKVLAVTAAIHLSKLDIELQPELAVKVLAKEITIAGLRRAVVETGEAHGKPVRTREIEPRKLIESVGNRCGESARAAGDLLQRLQEVQTRGVLIGKERKKLLASSLRAAVRDLTTACDILER